MKLFFLINSLAGGGAERVLITLLEYMDYNKCFLLEKDIVYEINKNRIEVLSNHTNSTSSALKTLLVPIYALKLKEKINSKDIVISLLDRANFVNIFSKIFRSHKAIISVHNDLIIANRKIKRLNKILIKLLYPKADLIIAVSEGVKDSLIKLKVPEDKIKVIYNPILLEEIRGKAKEDIEVELQNVPFLVTVGRLTYPKEQWFLIKIFKETKKFFPELKLFILGVGELKDYLVKLSENLNLKTYVWDRDKLYSEYDVYFLGFSKNPYKYMARAKLFMLTSLWEGLPTVLVEALACKVPCVSSDCRSGPREILAPDTEYKKLNEPEFAKYGILMPAFEDRFINHDNPLTEKEKLWIETIKELLRDEQRLKEYSQTGQIRAEDFSVEKVVKEWNKILEEQI